MSIDKDLLDKLMEGRSADVYYGRGDQILQQREAIKRKTMLARRLRHETENA